MLKWKNYLINIVLKSPPYRPTLVVRYEDIQSDRVAEISRILDFLAFPYKRESLKQRLEEDFGVFHRSRHADFEPFTVSQEQYVDQQLKQVLGRLSAENGGPGVTYGIEDYLRQPL